MVQFQNSYMTTGKAIALTRQIFVGKVMSLLFNMLSRLVITFLPRSKRLLISWLQSPSAVVLEPRKIKSATVSAVCHEVMSPQCTSLPLPPCEGSMKRQPCVKQEDAHTKCRICQWLHEKIVFTHQETHFAISGAILLPLRMHDLLFSLKAVFVYKSRKSCISYDITEKWLIGLRYIQKKEQKDQLLTEHPPICQIPC